MILLTKSSTSVWLEIILLANTNNYFRYSTLYFFLKSQTFRHGKPLRSGQTKSDYHLRNDGDQSSIGPANRRPPEERNAHDLFLQKIKTNGDFCGVCLSERSTKLKSAKVQNFFLLLSFPRGYFVFADTIR